MNLKRGLLGVVWSLGLVVLVLWAVDQAACPLVVRADAAAGGADLGASADLDIHPLARRRVIAENAGDHSALAVDANRHLHVSYHSRDWDGLYYGVYRDTAWYTRTVDRGDDIGRNSIAIDPTTQSPHISYAKGRALWYAHLSGAEWISSSVAADARWHRQNTIAVDSRGHRRPWAGDAIWPSDGVRHLFCGKPRICVRFFVPAMNE